MKIQALQLKHFTVYEFEQLEFPSTGVVLVTGDNGSGKSSIIEAIAMAGWGKSVRGTLPSRTDETCEVELQTDRVQVRRTRKQKFLQFDFIIRGTNDVTRYETNSKAQEALEAILGDFYTWRRTHVFSSHDALYFSLATDGERKVLLEKILGLERFDLALGRCREDSRKTKEVLSDSFSSLVKARTKAETLQARVSDLGVSIQQLSESSFGNLSTVQRDRDNFNALLEEVRKELSELETQHVRLGREQGKHDAELQHLRRQLAFLNQETCPSCQQSIPTERREELTRKVDKVRLEQGVVGEQASIKLRVLLQEMDVLRSQYREFDRGVKEAEAQLRQIESSNIQRRVLQEEEVKTSEMAIKAYDEYTEANILHDSLKKEQSTMEHVDTVLGLRGVRASLLDEALKALSALSNRWLLALSHGQLSLELSASTRRKSGAEVDAISLTINGIGESKDYLSASSGQQRRIDVALLMGLAEMGSSAHGSVGGTLFFDEVFDALDVKGTLSACEALQELASTRCVVVISHSETLKEALRPTKHLHVTNGKVEVR